MVNPTSPWVSPWVVLGLERCSRWDQQLENAFQTKLAEIKEAANHDDDSAAPALARLQRSYNYLKRRAEKVKLDLEFEERVDRSLKKKGLYGLEELAWEKRKLRTRVGSSLWDEHIDRKGRKNRLRGVQEQSGSSCCSPGAR